MLSGGGKLVSVQQHTRPFSLSSLHKGHTRAHLAREQHSGGRELVGMLRRSEHIALLCVRRTYSITSGGALVNSSVAAGSWAVSSGILSLTASSGNSSDVGLKPQQRTLARQGAFVRVGNAATGEDELFVLLAGIG